MRNRSPTDVCTTASDPSLARTTAADASAATTRSSLVGGSLNTSRPSLQSVVGAWGWCTYVWVRVGVWIYGWETTHVVMEVRSAGSRREKR